MIYSGIRLVDIGTFTTLSSAGTAFFREAHSVPVHSRKRALMDGILPIAQVLMYLKIPIHHLQASTFNDTD